MLIVKNFVAFLLVITQLHHTNMQNNIL